MAEGDDCHRSLEYGDGVPASCRNRMVALYRRLASIEQAVSSKHPAGLPPQLLVDGFDAEQIWQQADVCGRRALSKLRAHLPLSGELIDALPDLLAAGGDEAHTSDGDQAQSANECSARTDGVEPMPPAVPKSDSGGELSTGELSGVTSSRGRRSQVDDNFFRLSDMEAFCEQAERPTGESMLDDVDDQVDDSSEARARYTDFFDPPPAADVAAPRPRAKKEKRVTFDPAVADADGRHDEHDDLSDDAHRVGDNEDGDHLSTFEQRQRKMRKIASELEENNLADKGWQMSGEADAQKRPDESLLQEHLAFDRATKLPPVITEDTTLKLEDMIKQRIKDKAFDDVERKVKPQMDAAKYRNELVLDQQKSTKSLADVYEEEFVKQSTREQEEKKDPKHEEIERDMKQLFEYLDGLYNFHYAPKTASVDLRVVNNIASLQAEDVAPTVGSDATTLAPEEILAPSASAPVSREERTRTEVQRAKRKRKKHAKLRAKQQQATAATKAQADAKEAVRQLAKFAKVDKKKASNSDAKGAALFAKLQKQVADDIRVKDDKLKARTENKTALTGVQFKL